MADGDILKRNHKLVILKVQGLIHALQRKQACKIITKKTKSMATAELNNNYRPTGRIKKVQQLC